jgi:hypothetical protein
MTEKNQKRKLYLSHAYAYAGAISVRLSSQSGREDLLQWMDLASEESLRIISRPQKKTLLHSLIHDLALSDWGHEITHWNLNQLDEFFRAHDEVIPKHLKHWTEGNSDKLWDRLERPLAKLEDAAFHLLFGDRNTLLNFNGMVAEKVAILGPENHGIFRRQGVLRRPTYIPTWLRKAVFHRDQGRCQLCQKDLTGLISPFADAEFDHMWPLAKSGTNDSTNFQLLCKTCNSNKSDKKGTTGAFHYTYW